MDALSIIVLLFILIWFYFAVKYIIKNHRSGGCGSCGGNCSKCRSSDMGKCKKNEKNNK